MIMKFRLTNFCTQPGQEVLMCGDVPKLGAWGLRRAPRLEYGNGDTWFNELPCAESAGQPICFHFVVVWQGAASPCDGACLENLLPRRFWLPVAGRVKLEHDWETYGAPPLLPLQSS
jgi:hypothetical protein